ncbi:MAG: hypothetical protein M3179_00785 [Actinomycetota bacterium]|nr:hypothetical protein [Actinomycetota bacterium]
MSEPSEESPRFLGFEQAARLAGHCRWFEMRLFEVLGGWAEAEDDPRAKLLLRAHSFRHAWHAELWERRLPVSGPLEGSTLTVPASEEVSAVLEGLTAALSRSAGIERLSGLYRVVVPRLVETYTEHLERAGPVTEGPILRWLPLLVADEVAAGREGERLVEDLLATAENAERASPAEDRLAELVAEAGAIPSPLGLRELAVEAEGV